MHSRHNRGAASDSGVATDFDACFGNAAETESYDRATVELLQAEIEDLQATVSMLESVSISRTANGNSCGAGTRDNETIERLQNRIRDLVEEASRADERVFVLEEMLHAADDANRAELEERSHLEAWVGDIERRFEQRDRQHREEKDRLRKRVTSADDEIKNLRRMLGEASHADRPDTERMDEVISSMQGQNQQLQSELEHAQQELMQTRAELERQSDKTDVALREERAKVARELAEVSRLKFQLAQQVDEAQRRPSEEVDEALQHLLEEQRRSLREMREKSEREANTLSGRLKSLLLRVEDRY